jgi:hypothetical protein
MHFASQRVVCFMWPLGWLAINSLNSVKNLVFATIVDLSLPAIETEWLYVQEVNTSPQWARL